MGYSCRDAWDCNTGIFLELPPGSPSLPFCDTGPSWRYRGKVGYPEAHRKFPMQWPSLFLSQENLKHLTEEQCLLSRNISVN